MSTRARLTGKRAGTDLAGLKLSYLDRGDSLDLATFKAQPGPAKRPVRPRERYFRAPTRVGKPAFAGYTTHETLARLVEGDPAHLSQRDHLGLRPCQRHRDRGRDQPRPARQGADRAHRPGRAGDRAGLRPAARRSARPAAPSTTATARWAAWPAGAAAGRAGWCCWAARCGPAARSWPSCASCVTPPVGVIATASAEPQAVAGEAVALLERHGIRAVDLGATPRPAAQRVRPARR